MKQNGRHGFTLIELSIVLVIIGLIVGGVLVGKDLIRAAEVRAQISQIEQYQTAVATFQGKYGYLPGDMPLTIATSMGFPPGNGNYVPCDGSSPGRRNGDGMISGLDSSTSTTMLPTAETTLFWFDLSDARLIPQTFPGGGAIRTGCEVFQGYQVLSLTQGPQYVGDYLPAAKLGFNNFVLVFNYSMTSNGWQLSSSPDGRNYFTLSPITSSSSDGAGSPLTNIVCLGECYSGAVTVGQAAALDAKIDDGKPSTGNVRGDMILSMALNPTNITTNPCTDNANSYAMLTNDNGVSCALSFAFAAR